MTAQCAPEAQTKPEATGNKPSPTVVADIDPEAVLSPGWFEEDRITTLKDQFASARPYTHVVLPELCSRSVLEKARNEIIENVVAKYKETDLFKVYQTGDLANIDGLECELASKLPTLLQVRNAIYSSRFRRFIEQVTDLPEGTLIDKTDCSSNCYMHGGHLICHDDVISTRRVSYIIYLTDPEDEWDAEAGGALELYPVDDNSEPATEPTTCIPPAFNSMAMFTVQPGKSFHSVQQVYAADKPRLSISGWFHGKEAPPGAEQASIAQLKTTSTSKVATEHHTTSTANGTSNAAATAADIAGAASAEVEPVVKEASAEGNNTPTVGKKRAMPDSTDVHGNTQEHTGADADAEQRQRTGSADTDATLCKSYDAAFVPLPHNVSSTGAQLSAADKKLLEKWINPMYVQRGSMGSMVAQWEKSSCVQLHKFLRQDVAERVLAAMRVEDKRDSLGGSQVPSYTAGFQPPWSVQGPCHKQRFMSHPVPTAASNNPDTSESVGGILANVAQELFASEAFAKWLMCITELAPKALNAQVRRFRPGLDYTVATAGDMGESVQLEATLCFVGSEGEAAEGAWGSDEVGGFQCYIAADEEATAAAETYRVEEDDDTMISCSASFNTLNLILRDSCLMKFVKFVSHAAPSSRYDLAAAFTTDLSMEEMQDHGDGSSAVY